MGNDVLSLAAGIPVDSGGLLGNFGGPTDLGLSLLANAGPSPVRQPFGAILGRGALESRQAALQAALQRAQLQQLNFGLQSQAAMMPYIMQRMRQMQGGQQGAAPSGSGSPDASAAPQQGAAPAAAQAAPSSGALGDAQFAGLLGLARGNPQALLDSAKMRMEYDPSVAAQMAQAKDPMTQDLLGLQQARAAGSQDLATMYINKLRQDAGALQVARNSGIRQELLPNGQWSMYNPENMTQGIGNNIAPIPGALQTKQALAAAQSTGTAAGDVEKVTDSQGNEYFVPRSTLLGGGGQRPAATQAPGPLAGSAPGGGTAPGNRAALSPATEGMLKGNAANAVETNKEYQTQAEAGQQMLVQTQELRDAAADFTPGQFAESRMKMLQYLNSMHLITPEQMKSLGSAQAGQKIAIQLQAAATKQLGSREAAQIFTYMGKSLPNLTLSTDGLAKVSGYMDGIARYNMARAEVSQQRAAALDANGVNNVRNDFIKNTNPLYFVVASSPPEIQKEIVQSMGKQAPKFLTEWNAAAKAGWAPRPGQYWSGNAAGP